MRINEELKNLSLHDLQQRYASCFVTYDGIMQYVLEFSGSDVAQEILIRHPENGDQRLKFNYQHLDTSRLPSQWYTIEKHCMYLGYNTRRQFHRGYSDENCYLANSIGFKGVNLGSFLPRIHQSLNSNLTYPKSTVNSIVDGVKKLGFKQLAPNLVAINDGIYFRRSYLGSLKDGVFELTRPEFAQEINENVLNAKIKNIEREKRPSPYQETYNWFQPPEEEPPQIRFRVNPVAGNIPRAIIFDDNPFERPVEPAIQRRVADPAARRAFAELSWETPAEPERYVPMYQNSYVQAFDHHGQQRYRVAFNENI